MFSTFVFTSLLLTGALEDSPDFASGKQFYQELEYEQALFRFQKVLLQPGLTDEEKATVSLWTGLCFAGTGDLVSAERSFVDGYVLSPGIAFVLADPPPAVQQLAEKAQKIAADQRAAAEAEAAKPPPAPPSPAPSDATPSTSPRSSDDGGIATIPLAAGGTLAAAGAVVLLGSAVAAGAAVVFYLQATSLAADPNNYAGDALALVAQSNQLLIGAGVGAVAGVAVAATGGALIAVGVLAPDLLLFE